MLMLLEWSWCPHVRILFLSTPLSLNMWTYFSISAFAWGQARSKLGGSWYVHCVSCFYMIFIALWAVITHYVTILMPILSYFYKVYIKRENASSWNSGLEKEQILETFSAQLQKSWNSMKQPFEFIKNLWAKEIGQGAHTLYRRQPPL